MQNQTFVSVVIVNYFTESLAAACIRSVCASELGRANNIEFVIVDNGSREPWAPLLEGLPNISLIECSKNLGFARAANIAIRRSKSPFILLINPDSVVCRPGSITGAVSFLEKPENKAVAALGFKVYNDLEKRSIQFSARRFPGFSTALFSRYSLPTLLWPNNPWSRHYLMTDWQHNSTKPVDLVSGCAMLIRRQALEKIGLFDERYFMYIEDADWCRRAWSQGWQVLYYPEAEVVHQIAASSRHHPLLMILEHHRSMWVYYTKFFRHNILVRAVVFLGICARCVVSISASFLGLLARRLWKKPGMSRL